MIERFCDTLLLYNKNPEKTVTVIPKNKGSHRHDCWVTPSRVQAQACLGALPCSGIWWSTLENCGKVPRFDCPLLQLTWPHTDFGHALAGTMPSCRHLPSLLIETDCQHCCSFEDGPTLGRGLDEVPSGSPSQPLFFCSCRIWDFSYSPASRPDKLNY